MFINNADTYSNDHVSLTTSTQKIENPKVEPNKFFKHGRWIAYFVLFALVFNFVGTYTDLLPGEGVVPASIFALVFFSIFFPYLSIPLSIMSIFFPVIMVIENTPGGDLLITDFILFTIVYAFTVVFNHHWWKRRTERHRIYKIQEQAAVQAAAYAEQIKAVTGKMVDA